MEKRMIKNLTEYTWIQSYKCGCKKTYSVIRTYQESVDIRRNASKLLCPKCDLNMIMRGKFETANQYKTMEQWTI